MTNTVHIVNSPNSLFDVEDLVLMALPNIMLNWPLLGTDFLPSKQISVDDDENLQFLLFNCNATVSKGQLEVIRINGSPRPSRINYPPFYVHYFDQMQVRSFYEIWADNIQGKYPDDYTSKVAYAFKVKESHNQFNSNPTRFRIDRLFPNYIDQNTITHDLEKTGTVYDAELESTIIEAFAEHGR